ncbi:MAG: NAD-dependent epimerase/dehydratase family protein [Dehalococcoidia bacterium]
MRVVVIGANGFLGSAFVRLCQRWGIGCVAVTRDNYQQHQGQPADVVINADGNSKKYLAATDPIADLELSVASTLHICLDFPAGIHVFCSSVDVYNDVSDPAANAESAAIVPERLSNYGFHKYLAEQVVRKYAPSWLIVRLGGMVGPGLKKNPVFDVLCGRRLWVHPDSRYQYISTDDVASIVLALVQQGYEREVFNVCGDGLVSVRQVLAMVGREPQPSDLAPELYNVNIDKIKSVLPVPRTVATAATFVKAFREARETALPSSGGRRRR